MNEHSLDDLIIDDFPVGGKKSKGLLPIAALVIIVLVVGVFLAKMMLGDSNDINVSKTKQTEIVDKNIVSQDKLGQQIPPVGVTKAKEIKKSKKQQVEKKIIKKKIVKKEISKKETVKTKSIKTKVQKKIIKKDISKTKVKASQLFNSKATYYIQVGAFNRDPNPKFLKNIKDGGLKYIINQNGKTRRVRVGPYSSYQDAKNALEIVKGSIGIDGFVVKQK